MTMQHSKSGFLLAATLAVGALFVSVPQAWGQDNCVALSVPLHAYLNPAQGWIGQGWWVFGNAAPRYASEVTSDSVYEKSQADLVIGTEKTTVDFGNGDTFQLITRFIAHHTSSAGGVFEVTEIGTITNGTGKFASVAGVFFSPGTFGPGMSGDQKTLLWLGMRQGTICGLGSPMTTPGTAEAGQAQPWATAVRR